MMMELTMMTRMMMNMMIKITIYTHDDKHVDTKK